VQAWGVCDNLKSTMYRLSPCCHKVITLKASTFQQLTSGVITVIT